MWVGRTGSACLGPQGGRRGLSSLPERDTENTSPGHQGFLSERRRSHLLVCKWDDLREPEGFTSPFPERGGEWPELCPAPRNIRKGLALSSHLFGPRLSCWWSRSRWRLKEAHVCVNIHWSPALWAGKWRSSESHGGLCLDSGCLKSCSFAFISQPFLPSVLESTNAEAEKWQKRGFGGKVTVGWEQPRKSTEKRERGYWFKQKGTAEQTCCVHLLDLERIALAISC